MNQENETVPCWACDGAGAKSYGPLFPGQREECPACGGRGTRQVGRRKVPSGRDAHRDGNVMGRPLWVLTF